MSDQVQEMVREGRVKQSDYDLWLLFEGNDLGRRLLQDLIINTFMEDPREVGTGEAFAFQDGRRSVWRDIKLVLLKIHKEMEVYRHDRDSNGRERDYINR